MSQTKMLFCVAVVLTVLTTGCTTQTQHQAAAQATPAAPADPKIEALARHIIDLRNDTREPDSFKLLQVVTATRTEHGYPYEDIVCVLSSGRNGFGGISREWDYRAQDGFWWGEPVGGRVCGDKSHELTLHDDITAVVAAEFNKAGRRHD